MKIAVVGATGAVGRKMIEVLEEYQVGFDELGLFASQRSAGEKIECLNQTYVVRELTESSFSTEHFDIALFSAGGSISAKYAPLAEASGCIVIDNSSTFRQDSDKALIVPEVNFETINLEQSKIIANPNCSTIQCVIPLSEMMKVGTITRVDYSTYQAVSGAGAKGMEALRAGERHEEQHAFAYPIYHNVIPQIDVAMDNDYTKEEMKMVWETQKILNLPTLAVSATCVRVPVMNAHSVDIRVEFASPVAIETIKKQFQNNPAIVLCDDLKNSIYPTPLQANGQDCILVGRIRQDLYNERCVHLFCCADNLRKGAASNAVQIAKELISRGMIEA